MQAKITSLYDEGSLVGTSLVGAEGFAVLIETGDQTILFDTGRRGRYLLHNMMFLDIDAEKIDKVVISHAHAGHTGGLEELLRNRSSPLAVYAPQSAVGAKGLMSAKGVNIPEDLSEKASVYEIRDWTEIAGKVFVSHPMDIGKGLTELFIVIQARKGLIVISACSHAGVGNVMEAVKRRFGAYPHTYIGGVHIGKKEKRKAESIASCFKENNCQDLHLNHCTGVNGMLYLRIQLGIKGVSDFYAGTVLHADI